MKSLKYVLVYGLATLPIVQASAQTAPPTEPTLGVVAATGFARTSSVGYHALLGLETLTPVSRLRIRAEGMWADLGQSERTASLALTAVGSVFPRPESPYLLASWAASTVGHWQRGYSFGAGWQFRVGDRLIFAETRMYSFHDPRALNPFQRTLIPQYEDSWRFVYTPVSIGIRF